MLRNTRIRARKTKDWLATYLAPAIVLAVLIALILVTTIVHNHRRSEGSEQKYHRNGE